MGVAWETHKDLDYASNWEVRTLPFGLRDRPSPAQDRLDVLGVYIREIRPASGAILGEGLGDDK